MSIEYLESQTVARIDELEKHADKMAKELKNSG